MPEKLRASLICQVAFALVVAGFAQAATADLVSAKIHYPMPTAQQALLGEVRTSTLTYTDTFAKLARREGVGYGALQRANPDVDPWIPGDGVQVVVPSAFLLPDAPREGIVVNLSELRMYHYQPQEGIVSVYPIGIGDEGRETPLMETVIVSKLENPTWFPPPSIIARHAQQGRVLPRRVPPGPDNPLGPFAIQLAEKGYFIHGTNQPIGVGRRVSSGCIRLYNPHIADLVLRSKRGQSVQVIQQPYKVAWHEGALYLEAHPRIIAEEMATAAEKAAVPIDHSGFVARIIAATKTRPADVDWPLAFATARAGRGLPVRISR